MSFRFDLVIRCRTRIAAGAAQVWPHLERVADWKSSVVSVEHLGGNAGEVGEIIRVGQRPADRTVFVLMRTLRRDPPSFLVQCLDTEADDATHGYVLYSLHDSAGECELICDVVAKATVSDGPLADQTAGDLAREVTRATCAKLDADLAALKALIERAGTEAAGR